MQTALTLRRFSINSIAATFAVILAVTARRRWLLTEERGVVERDEGSSRPGGCAGGQHQLS